MKLALAADFESVVHFDTFPRCGQFNKAAKNVENPQIYPKSLPKESVATILASHGVHHQSEVPDEAAFFKKRDKLIYQIKNLVGSKTPYPQTYLEEFCR